MSEWMGGPMMFLVTVGIALLSALVLLSLFLIFAALVKYLRKKKLKMKLILLAGSVIVAIASVVSQAQNNEPKPVKELTFLGQPVTQEQIVIGKQIYAENCASCHGENLEGQPNWRRRLDNGRMPAPPHDATGHTWHHSDRHLFTITKDGITGIVPGYESDMPAYGEVLTDAEIAAVFGYIKSTWPERQRATQARISASDEGGS